MLQATTKVVPGLRHIALSALEREVLRVLASTDGLPRQLESLQLAFDEGPTVDAARGVDAVVALRGDITERWPEFGPRARALGITSVAAVPLCWGNRALGALSIYAVDDEAVPDAVIELMAAYAVQAAGTLSYAKKAENLEFAMVTRQQIGQAVGVLMERCGLSSDAAFNYLRRVSQTRNVKLRDVARSLVSTAELPAPQPGADQKTSV